MVMENQVRAWGIVLQRSVGVSQQPRHQQVEVGTLAATFESLNENIRVACRDMADALVAHFPHAQQGGTTILIPFALAPAALTGSARAAEQGAHRLDATTRPVRPFLEVVLRYQVSLALRIDLEKFHPAVATRDQSRSFEMVYVSISRTGMFTLHGQPQ
jgi:hypothetical protein